MPKSKASAYLDAVTRARSELAVAKATLEARLREELEKNLSNLQARLDIAVRYAYDNGHSKAQILQAMGSKYYGIVNESLERTSNLEDSQGATPLGSVYQYDKETNVLVVNYVNHGPENITGNATFDYKVLDDGTQWFMARESLWNDDYTERNEAVSALNSRQDGYYYEEALQWVIDSKRL